MRVLDKDINERLREEAKEKMLDLWDKIDSKLEDKKTGNQKKFLAIAASLALILTVGSIGKNYLKRNELMSENGIYDEVSEEVGENIKNNELENKESLYDKEGLYDIAYDKGEFNGEKVEGLEDLDLQSILEDKIVLSLKNENSYTVDPNSVDYGAISDNIVYGKVTSVKSYVRFGGVIFTDMTVEVIEDYKGEFKSRDTFIMGTSGGEMNYDEYISQIDPMRVEKFGYDKVEDKSKSFIELRDGIPMYREGEYVLVYVSALDNDEYYKERPEVRAEESYDYAVYKRLYVNPNTREVFKYEYKMDNTLKKIKAGTLDDIENLDLSINLH